MRQFIKYFLLNRPMIPAAFAILSHDNPQRLLRLTHALNVLYNFPPICCHHDFSRCGIDETDFLPNVSFVRPHVKTSWGAFNLLEASLLAMEKALKHEPEWIFLISGADYPIKPGLQVLEVLRRTPVDAYLELEHINPPHFSNDWHKLCHRRYFHKGRFPDGWECYAGSQWMTLSNKAVRRLLESYGQDTELRENYQQVTDCPDESYFHTILGNTMGLDICPDNLRYIDWSAGGAHPKTLGISDMSKMINTRAHFARKFDTGQVGGVLDSIDTMLGIPALLT